MGPLDARLNRLGQGPVLPLLAVLLMAVRFVAPSASAFLGVEGTNTSGFDAAMLLYAELLPLLAAALVAAVVIPWPGGFRVDPWIVLTLVLLAGDVVLWLGEWDAAYRLVEGPWASLPLGLTATATVVACGMALEDRVRRDERRALVLEGFRVLYVGFALALLLGALRFIDYRYALGVALPMGALWLLDYGPVLLLGICAVFLWVRVALPPSRTAVDMARSAALPVAGVVAGVAVSLGLGGFILSNTLAWGGAYEVFTPTAVSLAFVGFAVGCFASVAWTLRGRVPRPAWRFLVAGIVVAMLAGIVAFGGTLASVAGILLGLVFGARGLAAL